MKNVLQSIALHWKRDAFLRTLLILLCCVFIVYLPSLGNQFVDFDDILLIGENPIVHQFTVHSVHQAFTSYDPELYIPLTFITYMIEYALVGQQAWLYHLDSLLLHIGSTALVAFFIVMLTGKKREALIVAALFALHPLQVEAVSWVAARKDVLSTFFFLGSLCAYLRYCKSSSKLAYVFALSLFVLGLLSKVSIVLLPLCLLLIDWLRHRSVGLRQRILELVPFLCISILFIGIAWYGKHGIISSLNIVDVGIIGLRSLLFVVSGIVYPFHFSVLYLLPRPLAVWTPAFLVPALITVGICVASLLPNVRKQGKIYVFGWWFFVLCMLPSMTNVSKAGEFYLTSDRYAYIGAIGLFLMLAAGFSSFIHRFAHFQILSRKVGVVLCMTLGLLTMAQSLLWHDSTSLFSYAVRLAPASAVAHSILGNGKLKLGDREAAMKEFSEALALRPDMAKSYTPLAMMYELQGDNAKAKELLQKALQIDPHDPTALSEMGLMQYNRGNVTAAIDYYEQSLRNGSDRFNLSKRVATYNNLAAAYADQKLYDKEIEQYEKAVEIDPQFYYSYYNMGLSYEERGQYDNAQIAYKKTIDINENFADAHMRLAHLYAIQNDWTDALLEARIVKSLQANFTGIDEFIRQIEAQGMR